MLAMAQYIFNAQSNCVVGRFGCCILDLVNLDLCIVLWVKESFGVWTFSSLSLVPFFFSSSKFRLNFISSSGVRSALLQMANRS